MEAKRSAGYDMSHITMLAQDGCDIEVWSGDAAEEASAKNPLAMERVNVTHPDHYTRANRNIQYMNMSTTAAQSPPMSHFSLLSRVA